MEKNYDLCIISDPFANERAERQSRNDVKDVFKKRSSALGMPFNITDVWLSDLTLEVAKGGVSISLPNGDRISTFDAVLPRFFLQKTSLANAFFTSIKDSDVYCPISKVGYEATANKFNALALVSKLGHAVPSTALISAKGELSAETSGRARLAFSAAYRQESRWLRRRRCH